MIFGSELRVILIFLISKPKKHICYQDSLILHNHHYGLFIFKTTCFTILKVLISYTFNSILIDVYSFLIGNFSTYKIYFFVYILDSGTTYSFSLALSMHSVVLHMQGKKCKWLQAISGRSLLVASLKQHCRKIKSF